MGHVYHAHAKTTAQIRKEIQDSPETIARLATRLSLNPKNRSVLEAAERRDGQTSWASTPTVLMPEDSSLNN